MARRKTLFVEMYLVQYHVFEVSRRALGRSLRMVRLNFEYWQTPGLSGMDTIYGPARVTASDLVKKWRFAMQGGGSKTEEPRCLFSLTFMAASNRWLFFSANPACVRNGSDHLSGGEDARTREVRRITQHTVWFRVLSLKYKPPLCGSVAVRTVYSSHWLPRRSECALVCNCAALPLTYHYWTSSAFAASGCWKFTTHSSSAVVFGRPCFVVPLVVFPPEMLNYLSLPPLTQTLRGEEMGFRGTRRREADGKQRLRFYHRGGSCE